MQQIPFSETKKLGCSSIILAVKTAKPENNSKSWEKAVRVCVRTCMRVRVYVLCVYVWVCGCVWVCIYFLSLKRLLLTEQNNNCYAKDQVSNTVLRKYFCVKNLCRHIIDNHSRDLQASNCAKDCQLNRAEPREVKDNFWKFLKNQR